MYKQILVMLHTGSTFLFSIMVCVIFPGQCAPSIPLCCRRIRAALVGGISKCWCHFRARNRGNIFLASIVEYFSIFNLLKIKVVSLSARGRGGTHSDHVILHPGCGHKPWTDIASNLLAIELQLDVRIACNGLQQKFQHAEYFACDPLISQPIFIQSSNSFHHYSWWCDGAIIISIE